jgi:ribosomal-protein-alanine N-acetyltransferase
MEHSINDLRIRRMSAGDMDSLAYIERQCFSRPWSASEFAHLVGEKDALYLVAEIIDEDANRQIVGTAGMRMVCGEGDIDNVAVLPAYRNMGIASALLKALLELGRESGLEEFTLEVRVSNVPAIKVYEKVGFVSEGIRPGFYEDPKEDASIMWIRKKA